MVSVFALEVNGIFLQTKSSIGGGEISTTVKMLSKLEIKGNVIKGDALFEQEILSNRIVEASEDYLFKIKRGS